MRCDWASSLPGSRLAGAGLYLKSVFGMRLLNPLWDKETPPPPSCRQLTLEIVDFLWAKRLNKQWHSRLPRMGTGFVASMPFLSFAASHEGTAYAVAIWSNPVARNLPQQTWLELRRLAVAPDAPRYTASWMLGKMTRHIRKWLPEIENLISYQDLEVHTGTIYKATGWLPTVSSKEGAGIWDRPGRRRPKAQSEAGKQRWEKWLTGGVGSG